MSVILHGRNLALISGAALLAAISANQVAVAKSGAPPPAKFTPNVKADASLGSQGQGDNEPQVIAPECLSTVAARPAVRSRKVSWPPASPVIIVEPSGVKQTNRRPTARRHSGRPR